MELDSLDNWRKTHFTRDLSPEMAGEEVTVMGWVKNRRDLGGLRFIVLQDKYGEAQVTLKKGVVPDDLFEKAKVGRQWCVAVKATVKEFKKAPNGVELIPSALKILNITPEKLPIDLTAATQSELDIRLDNRVLDLRDPRNLAIFTVQDVVLQAIREYLYSQDFTEIQTPKIIATATEGGTELFPIMYFDREAFLSQSAQLYKEQLSSVFERVFEIAACYRAEKSHTKRHVCEIYVLDFEIAFGDMEDVLVTLENTIHHVTKSVRDKCERELKILGAWDTFEVPEVPFKRYTYTEILELLEKETDHHIPWGEDISTEAYRALGDILPGYYYVVEWPTSMKPFYIMPKKDDPKVSESFDLQKGWLELTSGGTRIHEKELLVSRLEEQGLSPTSFESHLQNFDFGMPPHAGMGLGIARLLTVLLNLDDVREAILFPRTPDRLTP
ncbi:MAG: aspartate--tRNA(Asn) ligase [Promethearchaeota archaeon]